MDADPSQNLTMFRLKALANHPELVPIINLVEFVDDEDQGRLIGVLIKSGDQVIAFPALPGTWGSREDGIRAIAHYHLQETAPEE